MSSLRKKHGLIYDQKQPDLGRRHTAEPGHEIDFDELLNNKERIWTNSTQSVEKEEYAIHIINYPLAHIKKHQLVSHAENYLNQYPEAKVYIPQDNGLKRVITPFEFISVSGHQTFITEEEVSTLIAPLQLSRKQVKVVDYATYHEPNLFYVTKQKTSFDKNLKNPEWITFDLKHFIQLSFEDFNLILDLQVKKKQPIFLIDYCRDDASVYRLKSFFFEKVIKTGQVVAIATSRKNFTQLKRNALLKHKNVLGNLSMFSFCYDQDVDVRETCVYDVLPFCTQLKRLHLNARWSGYKEFSDNTNKDHIWASQIEELCLEVTPEPFVYHLPNLKRLKVGKHKLDWQKLAKSSPQLQEVILEYCLLQDVVDLLRQIPSIQKLIIRRLSAAEKESKLVGLEEVKQTNLRDLRIINLSYDKSRVLSLKHLYQLLKCSPDLEMLKLGCYNQGQAFVDAKLKLPKLITFIGCSGLNKAVAHCIMQSALNLESVTLKDLEVANVSTLEVNGQAFLSRLKYFSATGTGFDEQEALNLLQNARHLSSMKMSTLADAKVDGSTVSFSKLETVHVQSDSVALASVKSSPIKNLKIELWMHVLNSNKENCFQLPDMNCKELRTLSLHGAILDKNFINILLKSYVLEELVFKNCDLTGLAGICQDVVFYFSKLKKIDIDKSRITASFMQALLSSSPSLQYLAAQNSEILGVVKTSFAPRCSQLKVVSLKNSRLQASVLSYIFAAAPRGLHNVSLELKGIDASSDDDKLIHHPIPQLEALKTKDFSMLAHISPGSRLKSLEYYRASRYEDIKDDLPEHIDFSGLEELKVEVDNLRKDDFSFLGYLFPQIKSLRRLSLYSVGYNIKEINQWLLKNKEKLLTIEHLKIFGLLSRAVLQYLPNLRQLEIESYEEKSLYGAYEKRALNLSKLTILTAKIDAIDDLILILQSAQNLQKIAFSFSEKLDQNAVQKALEAYLPPTLKYVYITGVSHACARMLKQAYPHSQIYFGSVFELDEDEEINQARDLKRTGFFSSMNRIFYSSASSGQLGTMVSQGDAKSNQMSLMPLASEVKSSQPIKIFSSQKPLSPWMDNKEEVLDGYVQSDQNISYELLQRITPDENNFPKPHEEIEHTYSILELVNGKFVLKKGKPNLVPLENVKNIKEKDIRSEKGEYLARVSIRLVPGKIVELPGATTSEVITYADADQDIKLKFLRDQNTSRCSVMLASSLSADEGMTAQPLFDCVEFNLNYILKSKVKSGFENPLPAINKSDAEYIVSSLQFIEKGKNKYALESGLLNIYSDEELLQAVIVLMQNPACWGPKEVDLSSLDGVPLLNALLQYRTGACRHRSILIKALADCLGIPCDVDANSAHMMVRIGYRKNMLSSMQKYRIDLGGYYAPVKIHTMPKSEEKKLIFKQIEKKEVVKKEVEKKRLTDAPVKQTFFDFYVDFQISLEKQLSTKRNALLYFSNGKSLLSFLGEMLQFHKNDDVCYVDDLEEVGSNAFCVNSDNTGVKVGSELRQFLDRQVLLEEKTGKPATGVLIINCSKSSSSIFKIYQALDPRVLRFYDVGKRAPGVKIICLSAETYRTDKSFLSRFPIKPKDPSDLVDSKVSLEDDFVINRCVKTPADEKSFVAVDLFYGDFYKTELLGKPSQTKDGYQFKTTAFSDFLLHNEEKNPPSGVEIFNPCEGEINELYLKNRPLYIVLLRAIAQKKVFINGFDRQLPKNFGVALTKKEYDFSKEAIFEEMTIAGAKECAYVMNPETYSHFLKRIYCEKNVICETDQGILSEHKEKSLTIRVTHSLVHAGLWQRFFMEAKKNHVALRLILDHGVSIPGIQNLPFKSTEAKELCILDEKNIADLPRFSVVKTTHPQASADDIAHALKARLIYVSKTHTFSDLFESFKRIPKSAEEKNHIDRFECSQGELISRLMHEKTVVLAGYFSPELVAKLSTLAASKPYLRLNGKDEWVTGRLVIVTQEVHLFPVDKQIVHHPLLKPKKTIEKKSEVKAVETKEIDELAQRHQLLENRVQHNDTCTIIDGATAVGKSTTVLSTFPIYHEKKTGQPVKVFSGGIDRLKECLAFHKKNPKVLSIYFSDETNLEAAGKFDFLRGFDDQQFEPGVMLDRDFYPKHPHFKILRAGNFGSEYIARQVHAEIEDHPEMKITMAPFSQGFIKNYFLKPLLKDILPEQKSKVDLDKCIDSFFVDPKYLLPQNDLTIRNWIQMCFRLAMFLSVRPSFFQSIEQAAALAVYDEVEYLISSHLRVDLQKNLFQSVENYSKLVQEIDKKVALDIRSKLEKLPKRKDGASRFLLTPSRYHQARLLDDQLKIREFLKKYPQYASQGVRCTAFEGAAAVGKTVMVLDIFEANGFVELADAKVDTDPEQIYCIITPSNLAENIRAFHNGYIVFVDEFNVDMQEAMFNDFSTGVGKEGEKSKEGNSGWRLIVTQNPATSYAERESQSRASRNRFHTIPVLEYPPQEYFQILLSQGVSQSDATNFMVLYQYNSSLTYRDLEAKADQRLRSADTVAVSQHQSAFFSETFAPLQAVELSRQNENCVLQ